jgi:hypothetical protein
MEDIYNFLIDPKSKNIVLYELFPLLSTKDRIHLALTSKSLMSALENELNADLMQTFKVNPSQIPQLKKDIFLYFRNRPDSPLPILDLDLYPNYDVLRWMNHRNYLLPSDDEDEDDNKNILKDIIHKAKSMKQRWPEGEIVLLESVNKHISSGLEEIIKYAKEVIKDRWIEGERIILQKGNPFYIKKYAKDVVKGRWLEGEEVLAKRNDIVYTNWYNKDMRSFQ